MSLMHTQRESELAREFKPTWCCSIQKVNNHLALFFTLVERYSRCCCCCFFFVCCALPACCCCCWFLFRCLYLYVERFSLPNSMLRCHKPIKMVFVSLCKSVQLLIFHWYFSGVEFRFEFLSSHFSWYDLHNLLRKNLLKFVWLQIHN